MAKTYEQVRKEIDELKREAERLKQKEVEGVIARIKEAMATYGLTAADLGVGRKAVRSAPASAKTEKGPKRKQRGIKFRDGANTWGGRGPRPQWLRDALASGKQLSDFAV